MSERDAARLKINTTPGEKWIALKKCKTLRNMVTQQIRLEVKQMNGKRIDEACNESEYWKIVNDITNPRTEPIWNLNLNGVTNQDDAKIAETFNEFFVNKIEKLKSLTIIYNCNANN